MLGKYTPKTLAQDCLIKNLKNNQRVGHKEMYPNKQWQTQQKKLEATLQTKTLTRVI
jgi:hypothetical protein